MKNIIKITIRCVCFCVVFVFLFTWANQALYRKCYFGEWNTTTKINGFYNEPENSFDVLAFGSSHMYCTMNPIALWKHSGIPSYTLTSQQQPVNVSYYFIKEALKTQKPKVVVLDLYMATKPIAEYDEGIYHDAIDFLKMSKNRFDMINDVIPAKERKNFFLPFLKYHTRWNSLTEVDFDEEYRELSDSTKGYVFLKKASTVALNAKALTVNEKAPVPKENLEYLDRIVALSEEHGFELLFIVAPYCLTDEQPVIESLKDYAAQKSIGFIDFNTLYAQIELDPEKDFFDTGHTNCFGAEKAMKYLGEYLSGTYALKDRRGEELYRDFDEKAAAFYAEVDRYAAEISKAENENQ